MFLEQIDEKILLPFYSFFGRVSKIENTPSLHIRYFCPWITSSAGFDIRFLYGFSRQTIKEFRHPKPEVWTLRPKTGEV